MKKTGFSFIVLVLVFALTSVTVSGDISESGIFSPFDGYTPSAYFDTPGYQPSTFFEGLEYTPSNYFDTPGYQPSTFFEGLEYTPSNSFELPDYTPSSYYF